MEKHRLHPWWRKGRRTPLKSFVMAASCLFFLFPFSRLAYALPYGITGYVKAEAGYDREERQFHWSSVKSYGDEAIVSYQGAWGIARYSADLATASVRAYSEGISGEPWSPGSPYFWTGRGYTNVGLEDTLYFHVPPGNYQDGLYATLKGKFSWSLYGDGAYSVVGSYRAAFQRQGYAADQVNRVIHGAETGSLSFSLVQPLIDPGTILSEPRDVTAYVDLDLGFAAAVIANVENNVEGSYAVSNFYDTGRFTALDVPAGVTWTSASGVFLIPLPASILLLGSGLAGLAALSAGLKYKRRP